MSLIKLATGYDIRSGKHGGQCFQNSLAGPTIKNNNHVRRHRSPAQMRMKKFLMRCVQQWRQLSGAEQADWDTWASTFPQPTLLDPAVFLTGYENFVKRNYYLYLSYPDTFSFMTSPVLIEYSEDFLTPVVSVSDVAIFIDCTFSLGDGNQDCLIFLSRELSTGRNFGNTFWRFVASIRNTNQSIDITQSYLASFGVLPAEGENLFVSVVFCGKDNGQFTFHKLIKITVEPPAPLFVDVNLGRLYNFFNISVANNIAASGWHVPTRAEWLTAFSACGGISIAGGKLKENSLSFWNSPNTSASDFFGFAARGTGHRKFSGGFEYKNLYGYVWSASSRDSNYSFNEAFGYNSAAAFDIYGYKQEGYSIRLVKNDSNFVDYYQGNDGKVYHTCQIGSQIWTAQNLIESELNDHSLIPEITDNAAWQAILAPAFCSYDNDPSND